MISRIEGRIASAGASRVEIDLGGGLWREVQTPAYLAEQLGARTGEVVTLFTLEYLESVHQGASFVPRLLGFARGEHRRLFELLTSVKGLGAKRALRAMAIEPERIAGAIARRDARALIELPEVGKKLAETILLELADKVGPLLSESERSGLDARSVELKGGLGSSALEAIAGLEALGESAGEAERLVRHVLAQEGSRDLGASELLARALHAR